jgi:cytochrome c oxidase subunit 3
MLLKNSLNTIFKKDSTNFKSKIILQQQHPFHLVDPSPWPLFTAFAALGLTTGMVMYMHRHTGGGFLAAISFITLVFSMTFWWRDVVRESTFEGHHTFAVQAGLRLGMILFIVSEIMFFVAFFWAFFHSSLAPSIQIGCIWPPTGIEPFDPLGIPLLNTLILLLSGATITWGHYATVGGNRSASIYSLFYTILLGLIFTVFQGYEYMTAPFTISDGIYGSVFYMATGFHGFHVLVGTLFILVCFYRQIAYHFSTTRHLGLEFAAWYWHFVDVVWLFLYASVYCWGS